MEGVNLPGVGDTYLDPRMATAVKEWIDPAADQGVDIHFNSAFRVSGVPVEGAVFTLAGDTSLQNAELAVNIRYGKLTDIIDGLTEASSGPFFEQRQPKLALVGAEVLVIASTSLSTPTGM